MHRTTFTVCRGLARAVDSTFGTTNLGCLAVAEIILPGPRVNRAPFHYILLFSVIVASNRGWRLQRTLSTGDAIASVHQESDKTYRRPGCRVMMFSQTQPAFLVMLGQGTCLSRLQSFDMFEDSVETDTDRHL